MDTMKFLTKPILAALDLASSAIPSRQTLPVLTCAKIEVRHDSLTITGDSLDARVSVDVSGIESDSEFTFLAPPRLLKAALRGEEATLEFDAAKNRLHIKSGGTTNLSTLPVKEFPEDWKTPSLHDVDAAEFLHALRMTINCASQDEARQTLCGAIWNPSAKELAATDGAMLIVCPIDLGLSTPAIIPTSLARIVAECFTGSEPMQIGGDESRMHFAAGYVRVWGKLIEGSAPNYRQVIPHDTKPLASLGREALLSALSSLDAFIVADSFQKVRAQMGNVWTFSAGDGNNETSVVVEDVTGATSKPETISLNRGNLIKLMRHWTADRVAVSTDERCLMLRPEDETGVMGLTMKFRSEAS